MLITEEQKTNARKRSLVSCELIDAPVAVTYNNKGNHMVNNKRKQFFYSTLSEFENVLLCERILINLTTCQNETSS
jgi:hypothetical protein